jgi:hypothetical protein
VLCLPELLHLLSLLNLLHLELDISWLFVFEKVVAIIIFIIGLLFLVVLVGIFAEDQILRSGEFSSTTEHWHI